MNFASASPATGSSHALSHSRVLGVIPARLSSSRLPRKPLHPILGRPLIEWVWRRVSSFECLDRVVVATDADEVAAVCREIGAEVAMTDPSHPSGTDRVAEVAAGDAFRDYGIVANLQGDEPLLDEETVRRAVALVRDDGFEIGTCATPIRSASELGNPSAVKVVRTGDGRALYFSRAEVPFAREAEDRAARLAAGEYLRHVGLYVSRRDALARWVALPQNALETTERLEQLRPLAAGLRIGVAVVEAAAPGVDTPADVAEIEARLSELGHTPNAEAPAP